MDLYTRARCREFEWGSHALHLSEVWTPAPTEIVRVRARYRREVGVMITNTGAFSNVCSRFLLTGKAQ